MSQPQRGLISLAPIGEELQKRTKREQAESVICPVHPTKSGVRLRAGMDKRGRWQYFEPLSLQQSDTWRVHSLVNNAQFAVLVNLGEKKEIEARQGPAGCVLFYYVEDETA